MDIKASVKQLSVNWTLEAERDIASVHMKSLMDMVLTLPSYYPKVEGILDGKIQL